ncbi:MAG: helix-turn-helix domain-containing protein [Firmicutes bacterium]|nr:helix-turn-helix domain-containing protein [Bacillota bacterium]
MRDEILYTPEELAQKLKLSKYTIYEMIKRGEISAHRIGRSLRVTESQLETYLMQSRKAENSYEAEIVSIDDEKFAKIIGISGDVYIAVNTDIEGSANVTIKPEDVILSLEFLKCSARNNIQGIVTGMEELPGNYKVTVNIGVPLIISLTKHSVAEMGFQLGDTVYAVFKAMSVTVV